MRATMHNGRAGKNGVYSAKHNDRNFESEGVEHINSELSSQNFEWKIYEKAKTFEECEQWFYEKHFRRGLSEKNSRYEAQGHAERCRTIEEYRKNERSCPEETIIQIGRKDDTIDPKMMQKIILEQIAWEEKTFPQVKILDAAFHVDEAVPHLHERKVWIAHDKDGLEIVSQSKSLEEMGIERPDPEKVKNRFNNAKQTYSKMCRDHFIELCRSYGLEIETEPLEASKKSMELQQWKYETDKQKVVEIEAELTRKQAELVQVQTDINKASVALAEAKEALKKIPEKTMELKEIEGKIASAQDNLEKTLDLAARSSVAKRHFFGENKDLVTYHKNTLEDVEAIGREARKHMEEAREEKEKALERIRVAESKEKQIEPLYKAAELDRLKAQSAKERAEQKESQIDYQIDQRAQQIHEEWVKKAFNGDKSDRQERLEEYCSEIRFKDGQTILEKFDAEEQERMEKMQHSWHMR